MSRRALALLLSPLGLILISAGRLLVISDYNTTTATAVASSTGYFNTLLGTLIPLIPAFIPYLALLLLLLRQFVLSIIAFAFTAFIAPTPLARAATRQLVIYDTRQLLSHGLASWPFDLLLTAIIGLAIGIVIWVYLDSVAEALAALLVLAIVVFLLFTPLAANLSRLQPASTSDHHILTQINSGPLTHNSVVVLVICALLVLPFISSFSSFVTGLVAVVAALALFPYVSNFYPAPGGGNYYVTALRTPWLSPEKVTLRTGRNYYGYVLDETADWFTVLRSKNRKIVYIPAKEVIRRSACEPALQAKGDHISQPIANTFYQPPPHIKVCADAKYLKLHKKRHTPLKAAHLRLGTTTRIPPTRPFLSPPRSPFPSPPLSPFPSPSLSTFPSTPITTTPFPSPFPSIAPSTGAPSHPR
jgi:hypothetical protein